MSLNTESPNGFSWGPAMPKTTPKGSSEYSADDISHLEGLDAVRKRPGMYIGSTDSRGLIHLLWEIVDNSVDEALAGFCTRIEVTLHADGSLEVADNGRGIPVDINKKSGRSGLELALTELHAGGKFGGKAFAVSGGLHGVGASVTNALSARLDATVRRDGKVHTMCFQRGVPGVFAGDTPDSKFTAKKGISVTGKVAKKETGTTIRFWPDRAVFLPDATIDPKLVADRLQRTAFLVPGLTCVLEGPDRGEEFCYQGGLADMAQYIATGSPISKSPIVISGSGEFTENVPVLDENGHMEMSEIARHVDVEVAIQPTTGYDGEVRSFVNVVSTPLGGTHQKGFEAGLLKWVRDNATLKAKDEPPKVEDCLEGAFAIVSVKFPEPQYEGQTKEILGTKAVQGIVRDVVADGLAAWAKGRGNGQAAKTILEKAVTAARIRMAAREQRDTQRRKTALEGSNMPAKLVDCRSRVDSELLIVEGDSALGTAKAGRFASHQALLPIRGKILNVQKADLKATLSNAEVGAIIQCIGAGSGKTFDIEQMRYERVILLADADIDGMHIECLLITLFSKLMRPLVEAGRLFVALPPLHAIKVGGRNPRTVFTLTHSEMESTVAQLKKAGENIANITRMKGLGEMDAHELRETTLNPSTRSLKRVTMDDIAAAENELEKLMGSDVEARRQFLMNLNTAEVLA